MQAFTHHAGQWIDVGDGRLYVEETGNPEGLPVLLLHGGMGCLTDFNPLLVDGALREFRLIGMDFRGHGRSPLGAGALSYRRHEQDVEAVLAALGLSGVSILGFSDGGIVAYRLAARMPDRVRAIVTLGAQYRLQREDPVYAQLAEMTPELWSRLFPAAKADHAALNPEPDFDRLVRAVVGLWTDLGPDGYPGERVGEIRVPTLIARGDSDFLMSMQEATDLQRCLPGASLFVLPFVSHEIPAGGGGVAARVFLSAVVPFLRAPEPKG